MENTNKSIAKLNEWKRTSIFYNVFFFIRFNFLYATHQTTELPTLVVLWSDKADLARIVRPNTVEMAETDNKIYGRSFWIRSSGNAL
jgi:hypothetical protein